MTAVRLLIRSTLNALDIIIVCGFEKSNNADDKINDVVLRKLCCEYDYVNVALDLSDVRLLVDTACKYGAVHLVRYLYNDVISRRDISNRSITIASEYGHLELVKYLVSTGADIHARGDYAVRWASAHGHLEVVRYLVSQGADAHAHNGCALIWASLNGHLEVAKYLEALQTHVQ
jgi:ankyrin repeat protein